MYRGAASPIIFFFLFVICGTAQPSGRLSRNQEAGSEYRFSVIHLHQSGDRGCKGWLTSNSGGIRFQGLEETGKKEKVRGVHTLDFPFKIIKEIKKGKSLPPLIEHNQQFEIRIITGVTYHFVGLDEKGTLSAPDDLLHAVALTMADK